MNYVEQPSVERVQHGVLTTSQAIDRFGRAALRRNIGAGRWVKITPRVVVLHNGPLTPEQALWVALLAAPRGSVLGSWSALAFDGFVTVQALPAHIVIPDGARQPASLTALPGVLVTRSSALTAVDVWPGREPPRTRPARSLVDAAVRARTPGQARLALLQGAQAGLSTPADLRAVLDRRGQCRYLGLLREVVDDIEGGERSVPEHRFTQLVRRAGLPPPARQAVVRGPFGRYYLDADWPEYGVSVEVHGAHHALGRQREKDWQRHNLITVTEGRRVLHFTAHQVRHEEETVAGLLRRALIGDGNDLPTSI